MNPVGWYVVVVSGILLLLGLGALTVSQARAWRRDEPHDRSPAAIIARVRRERADEDLASAPTEVLSVLSPDEVPTMPAPVRLSSRARE
ncbi:hypothetical protein GCM10023192_02860 [Amycolatopsis samaneae]